MAGFIEFSPNFAAESAEYMLFEFPPELRSQLKRDGSVSIQEYKNDSYILGEDKLYQLFKYQISNLLLVAEESKDSTPECERLKVRSFQQSFFIPTSVRPFSRDILIHLKYHYTSGESGLQREELGVDYIKSKFVTNDHMLAQILESVGASVHEGYVINLRPEAKYRTSSLVLEKLVEKGILQSSEASFSLESLGLDMPADEEVKLRAILKSCFERDSSADRYRVSLKGLATLVVENLKKDVREFYLEDLVDMVKEGIALLLPKVVQDSFGPKQIALAVEAAIKKNFLIADNVDFNAAFHTYAAKNVSAVMTDLELLSETPLEK